MTISPIIPNWISSVSDPSERKMWKNGWKAIQEHIHDATALQDISLEDLLKIAEEVVPLTRPLAAISHTTAMMRRAYHEKKVAQAYSDAFPTEPPLQSTAPPLKFTYSAMSHEGDRDYQEDAFFLHECEEGILAAVFDGHCGSKIAVRCCFEFPLKFIGLYRHFKGDVYQTFNQLFHWVHDKAEELIAISGIDSGSTAVVLWIDKEKRCVYTATTGDSEGFICRNGKLIPLSCVRDWSHPKEVSRAFGQVGDTCLGDIWAKAIGPIKKELRITYPDGSRSPSMSRVIGDIAFPGCTHKPKIGSFPYQADDLFVLMSDGVIDDIPPPIIAEKLVENPDAHALIEFALTVDTVERDNLTALVIKGTL